jgi:hypothetical protein
LNIRSGALLNNEFSSEFEALLHPAERVQRLIWAAMAGAILLIIGLTASLTQSAAAQGGVGANASALAPFHIVAMALAVISLLVRSYGFSDLRLKKIIVRAASDPLGSERRPGVPTALSDTELHLWQLFEKIMPIHLIGWSVNEIVILLGLAAASFAGRFDAIYPFAFMAMVLHVLMYPRFEPFARRVASLGLSSGPSSDG